MIGESIELKNGAPTDSFFSKITFENIGYIVPTKTVNVSESIKILFSEITPSLDKKLICLDLLFVLMAMNFIKPKKILLTREQE